MKKRKFYKSFFKFQSILWYYRVKIGGKVTYEKR